MIEATFDMIHFFTKEIDEPSDIIFNNYTATAFATIMAPQINCFWNNAIDACTKCEEEGYDKKNCDETIELCPDRNTCDLCSTVTDLFEGLPFTDLFDYLPPVDFDCSIEAIVPRLMKIVVLVSI